jgi:hypothetical protein
LRIGPQFLFGALVSVVPGCGCDDVGYPAVEVTVINSVTGQTISLGGSIIAYENERQAAYSEQRPSIDTTTRFQICCTPGSWRIQINKAGFAPYDTTVRVRSQGRCDRPVLVRLTARLQPMAQLVSAVARTPFLDLRGRGFAPDIASPGRVTSRRSRFPMR